MQSLNLLFIIFISFTSNFCVGQGSSGGKGGGGNGGKSGSFGGGRSGSNGGSNGGLGSRGQGSSSSSSRSLAFRPSSSSPSNQRLSSSSLGAGLGAADNPFGLLAPSTSSPSASLLSKPSSNQVVQNPPPQASPLSKIDNPAPPIFAPPVPIPAPAPAPVAPLASPLPPVSSSVTVTASLPSQTQVPAWSLSPLPPPSNPTPSGPLDSNPQNTLPAANPPPAASIPAADIPGHDFTASSAQESSSRTDTAAPSSNSATLVPLPEKTTLSFNQLSTLVSATSSGSSIPVSPVFPVSSSTTQAASPSSPDLATTSATPIPSLSSSTPMPATNPGPSASTSSTGISGVLVGGICAVLLAIMGVAVYASRLRQQASDASLHSDEETGSTEWTDASLDLPEIDTLSETDCAVSQSPPHSVRFTTPSYYYYNDEQRLDEAATSDQYDQYLAGRPDIQPTPNNDVQQERIQNHHESLNSVSTFCTAYPAMELGLPTEDPIVPQPPLHLFVPKLAPFSS